MENTELTRLPPQNVEAEQALLGAILTNNHALEKVAEFLKPFHFASAVHAEIYQAILNLHARGHSADPITLKGVLADNPLLSEVGGIKYLMELTSSAVAIINAEDYAKLIFDRYLRRQLIALGTDIVNDAFKVDMDNDAEIQMGRAEKNCTNWGRKGKSTAVLRRFPTR